MLPLVQPLHEAGFVVLAINLRGRGTDQRRGATYGIREADDVKAAVELLRRRPYVDGTKIALVGIGTGGNAAVIAASNDPNIAAVAVINPIESIKELMSRYLGPKQAWLSFVNPLCRWTFELGYQSDLEELTFRRHEKLFETRPVLVERAGAITELGRAHAEKVTFFLDEKLCGGSLSKLAKTPTGE
jgi:alpha-beta hydrolase superfamily lysophospholipase